MLNSHHRPPDGAKRKVAFTAWVVFRRHQKHRDSTRSVDVGSIASGVLSTRTGRPVEDWSVLKRNADEIALPPDHAALADGVKLVKTQFEIQRQQIEGVEFYSGPGIRHVLNAAGQNTALRVKEQQRVL